MHINLSLFHVLKINAHHHNGIPKTSLDVNYGYICTLPRHSTNTYGFLSHHRTPSYLIIEWSSFHNRYLVSWNLYRVVLLCGSLTQNSISMIHITTCVHKKDKLDDISTIFTQKYHNDWYWLQNYGNNHTIIKKIIIAASLLYNIVSHLFLIYFV